MAYQIGRELSQHEIEAIKSGDSIAIIWGTEDVLNQAETDGEELTDDEAKQVLAMADHYHDANYGISWETLLVYINMVVKDRKK